MPGPLATEPLGDWDDVVGSSEVRAFVLVPGADSADGARGIVLVKLVGVPSFTFTAFSLLSSTDTFFFVTSGKGRIMRELRLPPASAISLRFEYPRLRMKASNFSKWRK